MYLAGEVYLSYFLEEPDDEGNLGPSAELHPEQLLREI